MTKFLLVGDTHANAHWLTSVVLPVARQVEADVILQVGDFGYWAHAHRFVAAAAASDIPIWFLDGNHEDHPRLTADVAAVRAAFDIDDVTAPVPLSDAGMHYLPRGARLNIDGVEIVVCGGARSIDRSLRTDGIDWFLEEQVTNDDIARCIAGGPAPVFICHDAPSGWVVPGLLPDADIPAAWRPERPACEEHRTRLREIEVVLEPSLVIHGHYHQAYQMTVAEPWGDVSVLGLSEDGTPGAFATLTVEDGHASVQLVSWMAGA